MPKKKIVTTDEIANYLQHEDVSLSKLSEFLQYLRKDQVSEKRGNDVKLSEQHYDTLVKSLRAAVTLEFATIPPYLCALWSIKDNMHPVAKSIREIVQEEMLHMALVSNLLASMGELSNINTNVPSYPGPLPGGVHEGLIVGLSGLTKEALSDFMWIERPVEVVPINHPYSDHSDVKNENVLQFSNNKSATTIGEFYDEILEAFRCLNPEMTPDNQISGPLAWTVAQEISDVEFIIKLIQEQGEGSGVETVASTDANDLSHYYRFLEVFTGNKLKWNKRTHAFDVVSKMTFPETWPVAKVPEGGHKREDVSDEVWYYLEGFDTVYTILINQLAVAWTSGGQESLVHAYETMFTLEKFALPLMKIRTPYGGGETYAPNFRYKLDQDKSMTVGDLD